MSYRPSVLDHLPKTRRGHGTTHPQPRVSAKAGRQVRNETICVNPTCHDILGYDKNGKARGEKHEDQYMNAQDWKEDHGFGSERYKKVSFEDCIRNGRL